MSVRAIVQFPDPRLQLPAAPVEVFDASLAQLADDLLATMRAAPGIGITAPHIGVSQRLVVLELTPEEGVRTYVNPVLTWRSDEQTKSREGSVSMPGVSEDVERAARVRVTFQDLSGAHHEVEADGLLSICLQHEIDQLDGIFWVQRLSRLKRDRVIKKYGKLRQAAAG